MTPPHENREFTYLSPVEPSAILSSFMTLGWWDTTSGRSTILNFRAFRIAQNQGKSHSPAHCRGWTGGERSQMVTSKHGLGKVNRFSLANSLHFLFLKCKLVPRKWTSWDIKSIFENWILWGQDKMEDGEFEDMILLPRDFNATTIYAHCCRSVYKVRWQTRPNYCLIFLIHTHSTYRLIPYTYLYLKIFLSCNGVVRLF